MSNNRKWLQKNKTLAYITGIAIGTLIISTSEGTYLYAGITTTVIIEIAIWAFTGPIGYIINNALCGMSDFFKALNDL